MWASLLESAATAQAEPITVLTATASHDDKSSRRVIRTSLSLDDPKNLTRGVVQQGQA